MYNVHDSINKMRPLDQRMIMYMYYEWIHMKIKNYYWNFERNIYAIFVIKVPYFVLSCKSVTSIILIVMNLKIMSVYREWSRFPVSDLLLLFTLHCYSWLSNISHKHSISIKRNFYFCPYENMIPHIGHLELSLVNMISEFLRRTK